MPEFRKILVPVDLHAEANAVGLIKTASDFAEKFDAELIFVNVIDIDFNTAMIERFDEVQGAYAKAAQAELQAAVEQYASAARVSRVLVLNGRSYSKVVEAADELGSDLILISAHRTGMKEFLLGMTAARVVRHAHCSVLVIRDEGD